MSDLDLDAIAERATLCQAEREQSYGMDSWEDALSESQLDVEPLIAEVRRLREVEAARLRDAAHPEFVPEAVMDAAFASQAEWWSPGDDNRHPAIQIDHTGTYQRTLVVATLIESVADAVYRATRASDAAQLPSDVGGEE